MDEFKKNLSINITLIAVLTFTVVHLLMLILNLFGVTEFVFPENFNYLLAFLLIILSLALYIVSFFLVKLKNIRVPNWISIVFYIAFFLFTNVYYITGLFNNLIAIIFLFAYVAVMINIICLSVFYNLQKDEKNRLKSSKSYITVSVLLFSIAVCAFFVLFITAIKAFFFPTYEMSTLYVYVIEMCTMTLASIIVTICFSISLSKNKVFINACLIKYSATPANQRSVKDKQVN